jgi:hypothetical protein
VLNNGFNMHAFLVVKCHLNSTLELTIKGIQTIKKSY